MQGSGPPLSARKEVYHVAYLRALCAVNGFSLNLHDFDYDSIDCTVRSHERKRRSLDLQLKATARRDIVKVDHIAFPMSRKNYLDLVDDEREKAPLFVVLLMPTSDPWLRERPLGMICRGGMFFRNMLAERGSTLPEDQESKVLHVRFDCHLTASKLRELVESS